MTIKTTSDCQAQKTFPGILCLKVCLWGNFNLFLTPNQLFFDGESSEEARLAGCLGAQVTKNNGVPFISSSEVILGINTVVFKATLRSRSPEEDGSVYKQTQSGSSGLIYVGPGISACRFVFNVTFHRVSGSILDSSWTACYTPSQSLQALPFRAKYFSIRWGYLLKQKSDLLLIWAVIDGWLAEDLCLREPIPKSLLAAFSHY